jgi:hypothetical protein
MKAGSVTLMLTFIVWELLVPFGVQAQQTEKMHKVGYLTPWTRSFEREGIEVFEETLRERGYVQDRNISIVYRSAEGRDNLLPQLASELLHLNVNGNTWGQA